MRTGRSKCQSLIHHHLHLLPSQERRRLEPLLKEEEERERREREQREHEEGDSGSFSEGGSSSSSASRGGGEEEEVEGSGAGKRGVEVVNWDRHLDFPVVPNALSKSPHLLLPRGCGENGGPADVLATRSSLFNRKKS